MSGMPRAPGSLLVAVFTDIKNNVLDRILTFMEWDKHKEEFDINQCKMMAGFEDELDAYMHIQKHGGLGPTAVIEKPKKEQTDEPTT